MQFARCANRVLRTRYVRQLKLPVHSGCSVLFSNSRNKYNATPWRCVNPPARYKLAWLHAMPFPPRHRVGKATALAPTGVIAVRCRAEFRCASSRLETRPKALDSRRAKATAKAKRKKEKRKEKRKDPPNIPPSMKRKNIVNMHLKIAKPALPVLVHGAGNGKPTPFRKEASKRRFRSNGTCRLDAPQRASNRHAQTPTTVGVTNNGRKVGDTPQQKTAPGQSIRNQLGDFE